MERKNAAERKEYLLRQTGVIFLMGVAYYVFSSLTGIYIPCIFRTLTGLKCPGCGVTHYVVAMLHGDLHGAFRANEMVFMLMPAILLYGIYRAAVYIRKGDTGYSKAETAVLFIILLAALAFGIFRNIT